MRISRTCALLVLTCLPFVIGCGGGGGSSAATNLGLIPNDASVVVVLHPKQFLELPAAKKLPLDELRTQVKLFANLDLEQITEAVLILDDPTQRNMPEPGAIFRFVPGVQTDKLFPQVIENGKSAEVNGKKCVANTDPAKPWLCWVDGQTAIFGNETWLKRMLDAKPSDSSTLHKRLKQSDGKAHLAVVFDADACRAGLKKAAANVPMVGTLPDRLSAVEFRLSGPEAGNLQLTVHATDDKAAQDVEAIIQGLMGFAKLGMAQAFQGPGPLGNAEESAKLQKQATEVFDALKISKSGAMVNVNLDRPNLLSEVAEGVAKAMQGTRQAARGAVEMNNLRQLVFAMLANSAKLGGSFPAAASFDKEGKPLLSWRVHMLPFLEEQALYQQFHFDEPWDSEHNKSLLTKMPQVFESSDSQVTDGRTRFVAATGVGLAFEGKEGLKDADVTDGLSKTLFFVQVGPEKAVPWTKPQDLQVDLENPWAAFGMPTSPRGFAVAFADGHVRSLSTSVDPKTLKALLTRNGEEPVNQAELDK